MSTHSLTIFKNEDDNQIAVLYRHSDGYPTGHGKDLKEYLQGTTLSNGIGREKRSFNGMEELVVRLLTALVNKHNENMYSSVFDKNKEKKGHEAFGNFYLYPAGTNDMGEEYVYELSTKNDKIYLKVLNLYKNGNVLFDGLLDDFDPEKAEKQ